MTLKKILAAALALLLMAALIGCAAGKDAVIATVDGENIYKWQFDLLYTQQAPYLESQNGWDLSSPKYRDKRDTYAQELVTKIAGELACLQEAKKLGLDQLSSDELAETDAEYKKLYADTIAAYEKEFAGQNDPAALAVKKYADTLAEKNLSEEKLKMNINNNKILKKLFAQLAENQDIPEADLKEEYESVLASNKENYAAQPELYGQQATGIVCFIPEGYVRVKHVLIGYGDEELEKIAQEQTNVNQLMAVWAQFAIENSSSPSAKKAEKEYAEADAALKAKLEKHYETLKPIADEVYSKAKAGENFDTLIEQYNTDPGMTVLPGRRDGYYMHQNSDYVKEFKDAAFSLQNVGDISEPIKSFYGYHVVQLLEKVQSRVVPFEEVKEAIRFNMQGNSDIDEGMRITLRLADARAIEYFPKNYF